MIPSLGAFVNAALFRRNTSPLLSGLPGALFPAPPPCGRDGRHKTAQAEKRAAAYRPRLLRFPGGLLLILLGDVVARILAGEVQAAFVVDLDQLDPDHIADVDRILDLGDAVVFQLGDVH